MVEGAVDAGATWILSNVREDGRTVTAHDEVVCMAVLEYYSHSENVTPSTRQHARRFYRTFSRAGLRLFVYEQLGVSISDIVQGNLRQFNERLLNNKSPKGYFFVQKASAELILDSARAGLRLNQFTVPDISIGRAWSNHWASEALSASFGERKKYNYAFPPGTPQFGLSLEAWIYPNEARGAFEVWLENVYVTTKFPKYLKTKLPKDEAERLIQAVKPLELEDHS